MKGRAQNSSIENQNHPAEDAMFGSEAHMSHYEMPNLAACLYDYTNKEQDAVLRCFRSGNYDSIRDLPNDIAPQHLIESIKQKITKNISENPNAPERDHKGKIIKLAGGGLFHEFEWMPDSFANFIDAKKKEKLESDQIIGGLHKKMFVGTHDPITTKYENPFNSGKKESIFPHFKEADDPYEASQDEFYRAKWIKDNKILHGDFKPSTNDKSLTKVNRGQLADIVIFLKEVIRIDWAEINFIIGTNPEEFIEIKFEKSADGELGLKSYMNNLIHNHETIAQFNLKKVMSFWGHSDSKYIYFMLMPPWIRTRVGDVYTSLISKDKEGVKSESEDSDILNESKAKKKATPKLYSAEIDI